MNDDYANLVNEMISSETNTMTDFERRHFPRFAIKQTAWVWAEVVNTSPKRYERQKVKVLNLSRNGIFLDMGKVPLSVGKSFHLILPLPMVQNITKIHQLDITCAHMKGACAGFKMVLRNAKT